MHRQFCGRTRREFVWDLGAGFGSVALAGLAVLLEDYADEPHARDLADALAGKDFDRTTALADAVRAALPRVPMAAALRGAWST